MLVMQVEKTILGLRFFFGGWSIAATLMDVSDVFLGGTDYVEQEIEASEGLETRQLLYLLKNNGEMCKSAKCGCFWPSLLKSPEKVQHHAVDLMVRTLACQDCAKKTCELLESN